MYGSKVFHPKMAYWVPLCTAWATAWGTAWLLQLQGLIVKLLLGTHEIGRRHDPP